MAAIAASEAFYPVTSPTPAPTTVPTDRAANDPTNPDCPPELQDYCERWRDNLIYQRYLILFQEKAGLNVALNKRNFNKNRNQFCRACPSMCKE
jgi:hypothetical protein